MTPQQKTEQREQVAACLNIAPDDVARAGRTLGYWFEECESSGATVYWGFWAASELDTII